MAAEGISHWLAGLSDDRLVALVGVRLGRVVRQPGSFDQLGALLSQVQSCDEAVRRLDRSAAQVVAVLAEAGGRLGVDELTELLGAGRQHVESALDRASALALTWPAGELWRTPGGLPHVAGPVLRRGLPYRNLLSELGLAALRELLAAHGLGSVRSTWDAVEVLSQSLPRRVPDLLAEQPALADALRALLLDQGSSDALRPALELGLLLRIGEGSYVPAEVEQALRGDRVVLAVEPCPELAEVTAAEPPIGAALALVVRARELLLVLQETPPRSLSGGGLGVKEVRRLAKVVGAEVADVVLLLQLLGTARLVGAGLQAATITGAGRRWLALTEEHAYPALVAPQLHPRAVLEPAGSSPSGLLLTVARSGYGLPTVRDVAQACCDRGPETDASLLTWLDWSQWRPGARAVRFESFSQPLRVLELLGLRAAGTPAPWLAALLAVEPAGLLDEPDVSAAAEALSACLPPAQDDVVLQADGTAVVAGRAGAELRALLDLLGRRESDHTWRLDAAGVRDALDAGHTGEQLLAELRRCSRHAVPGVVEQLVLDAARTYGRVRVHAATTLLRLDDAVLGTELLHDRRLTSLRLAEVVPGVLSSTATPAQVVAALRAAGHAPVGDGVRPPPPPPEPKVRTASPPVPQRHWGLDPVEVIAALRAGPESNIELRQPAAAAPDRSSLASRLGHLTPAERWQLEQAVSVGGTIELDYVDAAGEPTTRIVSELADAGHLLVGWCHLRDAERTFAPAGILGVRSVLV